MSASGISKREFARLDGCNERLVRRRIISGHLIALPDGTIDPALVGTSWRRGNATAPVQPDSNDAIPSKAESERIKENYNALLLKHKYERELEKVVLVEDVAAVAFGNYARIRKRLGEISSNIAPRLVAVQSAPEAQDIIYGEVCRVLRELSDDAHARVNPAYLDAQGRARFEQHTADRT